MRLLCSRPNFAILDMIVAMANELRNRRLCLISPRLLRSFRPCHLRLRSGARADRNLKQTTVTLRNTMTQALTGVADFQESMEALKHNFAAQRVLS
jgi:hypothetical protein